MQDRHVAVGMLARIGKLFSNMWGSVSGDYASQCRDESESCAAWAEQGECETNGKWMTAMCALSCNLCLGPVAVSEAQYKRSFDYSDFISGEKSGVWNVSLYLQRCFECRQAKGMLGERRRRLQGELVLTTQFSLAVTCTPSLQVAYAYGFVLLDRFSAHALSTAMEATQTSTAASGVALTKDISYFVLDLQMCAWLQQADFGIFMSNLIFYGDQVDPTGMDSTKLTPDLYLLENNWRMWQAQYLHANYSSYKNMEFVRDGNNICWGERKRKKTKHLV